MQKITYAALWLEITRKCNLNCAHCLRGDAQELNMSREIIDSILDNSNGFYHINLTGGEPLINLEGMQYLIDGIKRRHIFLGFFEFTTNGTVQNDDVVRTIKDYSDYIRTCTRPDVAIQELVHVSISTDSFHEIDSQAAYEWYRDKLSDFASVTKSRMAEVPNAVGRASDLPYAIHLPKPRANKIEYLAQGQTQFVQ